MHASNNLQAEQRTSALTAGTALVIMALAALFSFGYAHGSLVVQGDPATTYQQIVSSQALFKAEIFGWIVILISDIAAAWGIYVFLKPVHRNLSLLGAWLRLMYTAILAIALSCLIFVTILAHGGGYSPLFEGDDLQALAMLFLDAFDAIWSVGLIVFGGHLFIAGYLAFKSTGVPKLVSLLLLLASIGYITLHLGYTLMPQYGRFLEIYEYVWIVPMTAGELGFGLWLLLKGGKVSVIRHSSSVEPA